MATRTRTIDCYQPDEDADDQYGILVEGGGLVSIYYDGDRDTAVAFPYEAIDDIVEALIQLKEEKEELEEAEEDE